MKSKRRILLAEHLQGEGALGDNQGLSVAVPTA
jgi:hypothetical protein